MIQLILSTIAQMIIVAYLVVYNVITGLFNWITFIVVMVAIPFLLPLHYIKTLGVASEKK